MNSDDDDEWFNSTGSQRATFHQWIVGHQRCPAQAAYEVIGYKTRYVSPRDTSSSSSAAAAAADDDDDDDDNVRWTRLERYPSVVIMMMMIVMMMIVMMR